MTRALRSGFSLLGLCLVLGTVAVAGCGGDDDDDGGNPPPAAANPTTAPAPSTLAVSIIDFAFQPAALGARPGAAVVVNLKNDGKAPHTFTIDGVTDSGRLDAAATKQVTFTPSQAGALTFYCTIHGKDRMSGQLTVSASGAAQPFAPSGDKDASMSGQDGY